MLWFWKSQTNPLRAKKQALNAIFRITKSGKSTWSIKIRMRWMKIKIPVNITRNLQLQRFRNEGQILKRRAKETSLIVEG